MTRQLDSEGGWRSILSDLIRAVEAEAEVAHLIKDPEEKILRSVRSGLICYSTSPSAYSELPVKIFTKPVDVVDVEEVASKGLKIFQECDALLLRAGGGAVGDAITNLLSNCLKRGLRTLFVSVEEEAVMEIRERLAGRSKHEDGTKWLLELLVGEAKEVERLLKSWDKVEEAIAKVGRMLKWLERLWLRKKAELRYYKERGVKDVREFEEVDRRLRQVEGRIWKLGLSPSEAKRLYQEFGYRHFFASNPPTEEEFQKAMKVLMSHDRALRFLLDVMEGGVDRLLRRLKKGIRERHRVIQSVLKTEIPDLKLSGGSSVRLTEVSEWISEACIPKMWVRSSGRSLWRPRLIVIHGADLIPLPILWMLLSTAKKCLLVGGHDHPQTLLEEGHQYHDIMSMNIFEWQERVKALKN